MLSGGLFHQWMKNSKYYRKNQAFLLPIEST